MTASLYRKYNAFSNRESAQTEQKHRASRPCILLLTMIKHKFDKTKLFALKRSLVIQTSEHCPGSFLYVSIDERMLVAARV